MTGRGKCPCLSAIIPLSVLLGYALSSTAAAQDQQYRLDPMPQALLSVQGVHPRIYLNKQRIEQLRQECRTTHKALWEQVRAIADGSARRGPPNYVRDDGSSGDEQLWQREVGNQFPYLAMAFVITEEEKYLHAARDWALASCAYETWGLGHNDGMDLAAGHQLFGLALVYDWCYGSLDQPALKIIRDTLVRRSDALFQAAATGRTYWHQSYLQNHLWVNITGLAASGLALFDEHDQAASWLALPLEKYRQTMAALGPDGASHEGVGYWEYGVEYMLKFMDLARRYLNQDFYDLPWWRHTASYAQYLSLPREHWSGGNCIVDLADCPRGHWYGPDYLLRALAKEYKDGHAQWLAAEVTAADLSAPGASWLNLIWYDPSVLPQHPSDLATMRHFEDMGIVSSRADWSGRESLLVSKCGPFIGHHAIDSFSYDPGGGHVHPDANHFLLFGEGEWLIRDDGYQPKWTGQHNTLLVNGRGQLGEGSMWYRGKDPLSARAKPKILKAQSTPGWDLISGEAAPAYPAEIGLTRYLRHLIFLKPRVLIVLDEIAVREPSDLELRFHTETPGSLNQGVVLCQGKRAQLRVQPLTTQGVETLCQPLPLPGRTGRRASVIPTIQLKTNRSNWRNAVALSWSSLQDQPANVSLEQNGDAWTLRAGGQTVVFDWSSGNIRDSQ